MNIAFFSAVRYDSVIGGRTRRLCDELSHRHSVHFVEMPSLRHPGFFRADQPAINLFRYRLAPLPGVLHKFDPVKERWNRITTKFLQRCLPDDVHAIVSTPFWLSIIKQLQFKSVTYDCLDYICVQMPKTPLQAALQQECELAEFSDRIFCVSRNLAAHWKSCCGRLVHFVPNGVQESYLHQPFQSPTSPVAGFCGALYEWIDYSLLEQTVSALPKVSFSFTGPIRNKQAIAGLSKYPNVTIHPAVPFEQVSAEIQKYSVGLIPFVKNDVSFFCSPLKMYEYLALGKTVLSTITGESGLPVVYADSTADFISLLEKLLITPVSREICRKAVSSFTWERIASQIERLLL